ncbi:Mg/Co/Ni transporter MgtE (contains CBS domain) [Alteracholeplasma palmae J233]|uniref:Mg/Co/Ni transporter MgtE (Contains CBS domain) n=1 Tax=Alteracholeplasma palmae (strain ATCC 49389 / J233) TaxID=1318466 RepID=U4KRK1_ALTPJ|nr:magnesium transporter [Alteracholeplasma palmae]CCV64236.1 Mg/Co/Ni transporter MgtE (contains CBS domain) [Alteracholeplasma palmae J233]
MNHKQTKHQITKKLQTMHAVDIAKLFTESKIEEKKIMIQAMPSNMIDDVFIELEAKVAIEFFTLLDENKKQLLLKDLSPADLKPLFEEFNDEDKDQLFKLLDSNKRKELERLIKYDETKAASVMRSDYLVLLYDYEVSEAMKYLTTHVSDNDYIDTLFVQQENKIVGIISLKDLIVARKNQKISEFIKTNFEYVLEDDTLALAINKISNYDISVLAVLNKEEALIGVITADDILEEMALEYESNIDKFVAVGDYDESSNPFIRAKQRLPWLLASIVLNLVIALLLSVFSDTIDAIAALVLFQPLILGMAGNIGTQAIAVTILVLHNKTHETKELRKKHVRKEVLIGITNALIIGILGFLLSWVFLSLTTFDMGKNVTPAILSLAIALSLVFSMILSSMFGVLIPLVLTKLKIDPAAASGPVISTINDLVALVIYFGFATLIVLPIIG